MSNLRAPMKTFGTRRTTPAERIPFSMWVERDDVGEEHHFQARAVDDFAALVVTAINSAKDTSKAVTGMFAFMAKILDNVDGVPADWSPDPLPRKPEVPLPEADSWPTESGQLSQSRELEVHVDVFRAPKVSEGHELFQYVGQLIPVERAKEFTAHYLGSSRRRWRELTSEESDVSIREKDLVDTFEWMMGLAANRPTQPSS